MVLRRLLTWALLVMVTGCARTAPVPTPSAPAPPPQPVAETPAPAPLPDGAVAVHADLDPLTQRISVVIENRSRETVQLHHCTFLSTLTGAQQDFYKACQPKLVPLAPGAVTSESYPAYPPYENPTVRVRYDLPGQETQTVTVAVQLPSVKKINLYRADDLMQGATAPSRQWQLQTSAITSGFKLAADGETALLYPSDPMGPGTPPLLVHMPSQKATRLPLPDEGGWFTYGGWLPDGRLFLVGRQVWVGGPRGEDLKPIVSDLRVPWGTWPSPDGRYLALWGPSQSGEITLVDLAEGTARTLAGPFRRRCQDCGITLGWSPDGKLLAGSDADNDAGPAPVRIRVIDPFTGVQVRTYEGFLFDRWLPDGDMIAWRRADSTTVRIDSEGKAKQRFPGDAVYPSPDGRFLLTYTVAESRLLELATGREVRLTFPTFPRWRDANSLIVVKE